MASTRTEQAALLLRRIEESGLSSQQFAVRVMRRDPRMIRKWIARESPIPQTVLAFLEKPTEAPWP